MSVRIVSAAGLSCFGEGSLFFCDFNGSSSFLGRKGEAMSRRRGTAMREWLLV